MHTKFCTDLSLFCILSSRETSNNGDLELVKPFVANFKEQVNIKRKLRKDIRLESQTLNSEAQVR